MVSPVIRALILQLLHVRKRSYSTIEEGSNKENKSVFSRLLDIEAKIQRRVKEQLLRINGSDILQAKRQKTRSVEQVIIELGEEAD
jgi:hypothetical protein